MPRVVDPEVRRSQLTDVTARQIARAGLDGATLREVARAAGWTTGAVSHYFVDKRDLLLATFRSRADGAARRVEASVAAGCTPLEALIDSALPLDEERLANWRVWLAFWGAAVGDDELTAAQRERHHSFCEAVREALGAEVRSGRLRADLDLDREARALVSLLNGIAAQTVFEPERWPAAEQRRIVADHVAPLRLASPPAG